MAAHSNNVHISLLCAPFNRFLQRIFCVVLSQSYARSHSSFHETLLSLSIQDLRMCNVHWNWIFESKKRRKDRETKKKKLKIKMKNEIIISLIGAVCYDLFTWKCMSGWVSRDVCKQTTVLCKPCTHFHIYYRFDINVIVPSIAFGGYYFSVVFCLLFFSFHSFARFSRWRWSAQQIIIS